MVRIMVPKRRTMKINMAYASPLPLATSDSV
jgi:hypothetical protein